MIKEKQRIVNHPLFGTIRINRKFAEVLELKPFRELAYKSQLGSKVFSKTVLNAGHTRLLHSIGVMYLTSKLLDVCEKKFSKFFTITEQEREILELAALGHDIGHVAYSHSLEERGMKTHEERTIERFEKEAENINRIFGYDITSKVISIYQNNEDAKNQGIKMKTEDDIDILFIFTSLLVGSIDCDRMEYLMTDKYMTFGEKIDFTDIFSYITIVLIDGIPTVGFEKEAVSIIENMLTTRLNQYEYIYYDDDATLVEMVLNKYKKEAGWTTEYIENVMEYDILSELERVLRDERKLCTVQRRLAQVILERERKGIVFKKFKDVKKFEYFLTRLYSLTDKRDMILTEKKKVTIYNPNKNKVYIKDEDGIVKDIMEVSLIISNFSIDFSYVMVDLDSCYNLTDKEKRDIIALFEDNPVEIEKKFTFPKTSQLHIPTLMENFDSLFADISGVKQIGKWEEINNEDTYYIPNFLIQKGVTMRHRKTNKGESYYIKIPTNDGTSITKREEFEYRECNSIEQFEELATMLFLSKNFELKEKVKVRESVKINTTRYKSLLAIEDSIIEIACDFSTYSYEGESVKDSMLECELKEGNDLSLWYLSKKLKKLGFKETNESKQTRAQKALKLN